ncbi:MAG: DUF1330 domain-containing protein [Rhodobacteraceae bacterium]|nr:DUF1330 domain-containing protein [Paracoccaceae bacterium]
MPKGYWVVLSEVIDGVRFMQRVEAGLDALERTGGRLLVRTEAEVRAGAPKRRVAIVEFESLAEARQRFEDPAYQAALRIFDGIVDYDFLIAEGAPEEPLAAGRTVSPSWGVARPPETG